MSSKKLVALAWILLAPLAEAGVVKADYSVNVTQQYDIEAGGYQAITPIVGTGSFTVDASNVVATTNGRSIRTDFVATRYVSPLPFYLPVTSSGGDFGPYTSASAWGVTSDDPTSFVEGVNFSVDHNGVPSGRPSDTGNFNVSIFRYLAPRHGDGTSAYVFTEDRLVSFLQSVMQGGDPVHYYEGYQSYRDNDDGFPVFPYGQSWKDESARIVGIQVDGISVAVPEPSSWALMLLGILGLTTLARLGKGLGLTGRPRRACVLNDKLKRPRNC